MLGALCRVSNLQERDDMVQAALTLCGGTDGDAPKTTERRTGDVGGPMEEELFYGGAPSLLAASLLDLFTVEYSQQGSSRRALEEVAIGYRWDWIIEDGDAAVEVEGGDKMEITIEDVLVFASGASAWKCYMRILP